MGKNTDKKSKKLIRVSFPFVLGNIIAETMTKILISMSMPSLEQHELLNSLKEGHETSFTVLYNLYGEKIYHLAYRMVGSKEEAEDITQETFLQVYRNIDRFQGKSQLYTWIYTITKNLCYRVSQKQKKTSFASLEALIQTAQSHEIPPEITEQEKLYLINQVKEGCLSGLVRCLSFFQRTAFILHVLVRLPVKEVADILEKSEGATKVLVHRARQNLKTFLCQHCSVYRPGNPCRCENLIKFSLNHGWITPPAQEKLEPFSSIDTARIETEIKHVKTLTAMYTGLPETHPPEDLCQRIQHLLASQELIIFQREKV